MKRLFYLSLGMAAGVYASYRAREAAHAWTPLGLAEGAAGLGASLREMAGEVRANAADREAELRDTLQLDASAPAPLVARSDAQPQRELDGPPEARRGSARPAVRARR